MAVAGFSQDEIELTQHDTTPFVTGQRKDKEGSASSCTAESRRAPSARPSNSLTT